MTLDWKQTHILTWGQHAANQQWVIFNPTLSYYSSFSFQTAPLIFIPQSQAHRKSKGEKKSSCFNPIHCNTDITSCIYAFVSAFLFCLEFFHLYHWVLNCQFNCANSHLSRENSPKISIKKSFPLHCGLLWSSRYYNCDPQQIIKYWWVNSVFTPTRLWVQQEKILFHGHCYIHNL